MRTLLSKFIEKEEELNKALKSNQYKTLQELVEKLGIKKNTPKGLDSVCIHIENKSIRFIIREDEYSTNKLTLDRNVVPFTQLIFKYIKCIVEATKRTIEIQWTTDNPLDYNRVLFYYDNKSNKIQSVI